MNRLPFEDALFPHYNDAVKYCITLTAKSTHTAAEDLLQDALLKAILKYKQLEDVGKFRPWFFQIISRTYLSKSRLKLWRKMIPLGDQVRHMPEVLDRFMVTEDQQVLLEALEQLSKKERTALLLFEIGGFSIEEIKQIQGDASISAVKSRLSRSRLRMRRFIEALDEQGTRSVQKHVFQNLDEVIHETTQKGIEALKRG